MVRFYKRFGVTLEWVYAGDLQQMPVSLAAQVEAEHVQESAEVARQGKLQGPQRAAPVTEARIVDDNFAAKDAAD